MADNSLVPLKQHGANEKVALVTGKHAIPLISGELNVIKLNNNY